MKNKCILFLLPIGLLVFIGSYWLSFHYHNEILILTLLGGFAIALIGFFPWVDEIDKWLDKGSKMKKPETVRTDDGEWFLLINENGKPVVNPSLPDIGTCVELLTTDGSVWVGSRVDGFVPECKWMWVTATDWLVPGHPRIMAWREIE